MVRPVTDDDIGLKVLREPQATTEQGYVIDIVAIHGIGAHPDDSWYKNVGTAASPRRVNWLIEDDMLPAVAQNARIMRYGYQSGWFGAEAVRASTTNVAERMLLALKKKRKNFPLRPLIFIAHCFGGLVVLKALVDARHYATTWPGVFKSTTGLLFLGTPFRGAEGMKLVEMLEAARSEYQDDEVQIDNLKILEPGNEFLQELVDQFGKIRTLANKAQVACFYELKRSNVGKIVGKKDRTRLLVTESSGCLDLSDATRKFSLSRTHFDMNKFGKSTEEDFEIVMDVVQDMVSEAHGVLPSQHTKSVSEHTYIPHSATGSGQPVTDDNIGLNMPREAPAEAAQTNITLVSRASRSNRKNKAKAPKSVNTWSSAEDKELKRIVQTIKPTSETAKWKQVAQAFAHRSPYACEKRYEKLT